MSADPRHRGRPRGDKRAALSGWMSGRTEFTMRDAVHSLGWPMREVNLNLHRARASGEVCVTGSVRVPGAKRPVALYARSGAAPAPMALANTMQLWRP